MDGLWLENGPFKLTSSSKVALNPFSWHKVANVLYVDQPVGTGMSYPSTSGARGYDSDDISVDADFHSFLLNFLALHTNYQGRDIYFSGESHAGHYIPSIVSYILKQQQQEEEEEEVGLSSLNIVGAAIGNGWTDPAHQYDVSEFAFGTGLIGKAQMRTMKEEEGKCLSELQKGHYTAKTCFGLMDKVVASSGTTAPVCTYDIRKYGYDFPPGKHEVEAYMNRADVRQAIHSASTPQSFKECADPPYVHLAKWDGLGVMDELAHILESGVKVLFFNGQFDLICNHIGNERFLDALQWSGGSSYRSSHRETWVSTRADGSTGPAGYVQTSGNGLTYLLVLDAGHMVPLDVPEAALDMITRFLSGATLGDETQSIKGKAGPWDPASAVVEASHAVSVTGIALIRKDAVQVHFDSQAAPESSYLAVSTPGGLQSSGSTSPITVEGLQPGQSYTFQVLGGTGPATEAVGSEMVTAGCMPECGKGGVCNERGFCECVAGYGGATCESEYADSAVVDVDTLPLHSCEGHAATAAAAAGTCVFSLQFQLRPEVFPGTEFLQAVQRVPHEAKEKSGGGRAAAQRAGFDALLQSDLASSLSLCMADVMPVLVLPGGEGREEWRQHNVDVRLDIRVSSLRAGEILTSLADQWGRDSGSQLNQGVITRHIDYATPPTMVFVVYTDLMPNGTSPKSRISVHSLLTISLLSAVALAMAGYCLYGSRRKRNNMDGRHTRLAHSDSGDLEYEL
ncbi:unnamed protein product [Chrysoparadoxa australica]